MKPLPKGTNENKSFLYTVRLNMHKLILLVVLVIAEGQSSPLSSNTTDLETRDKKVLSLFAIVNFPNLRCTTANAGSSLYGTCISTSECTSRSGSASGTCAAGFGVCCYMAVSTCGSTVNYNNTYIQNPGYPSTYTPTATGTCLYTINKASSDVCQLRLDFQTFSGFSVTTAGIKTDSMAVAGKTGTNPPSISGTNTGYHMYVDIGADSGDTATVTMNWGNIAAAKQYNIFVQQIECSSTQRAPQDCVQYFTGTQGRVQSYNWAGAQLLAGMNYQNCIRTEEGYCGIEWKTSSGTTIDAFAIFSAAISTQAITATLAMSTQGSCNDATAGNFITIPMTSLDGISPIPVLATVPPYPTQFCGGIFGISSSSFPSPFQSNQRPFNLHLFTSAAAAPTLDTTGNTGFSLDYTQIPCGQY